MANSFQTALSAPSTPTGAPAQDPNTQAMLDEHQQAYSQLSDLLSKVPNIDYEAKFRPLIEQAQQQPQTKAPSAMGTFAAAMGSPGMTHDFLSQRLAQIEREKQMKHAEITDYQQQALKGDIEQQIAKGNFAKALGQSDALGKLNILMDATKRQQALEDYKARTGYLFGQKGDLEDKKASHAQDLVEQRVRAYAKAHGQNDAFATKLLGLVTGPAMAHLHSMLSRNPLTGEMEISPEDADRASQSVEDLIMRYGDALKPAKEGVAGGTTPTPSSSDPFGLLKK